MIIVAYTLVGQEDLVAKNSNYQYLNVSKYKGDNWMNAYLSMAALMSDVGVDVFVDPRQDIVDELVKRKYGAVLIYPSPELRNEFVSRASNLFSETRDPGHAMLAQHLNDHFEEEVIMMHDIVLHTNHTYGFMIDEPDYDLETIIDNIRETTHLKNNNSKETFIWGIGAEGEADAFSDNLIYLMRDKTTKEYYLIIDEDIIEDGRVDDLGVLYSKFEDWYNQSEYSVNEPELNISLSDMYEDISVTTGTTIREILRKLDGFLYVVNDN
jgi:hypothetical protein